jgi:hypothetical protein
LNGLQDRRWVELGQEDMAGSLHRQAKSASQVAQVKHRGGMQVEILFPDPNGHDEMHRIGDDIPMGEHDPFGASGGPARVEYSVEVIIAYSHVGTTVPGRSLLHQVFVVNHPLGSSFTLRTTLYDTPDGGKIFTPRSKSGKSFVNDEHPGFTIIEDKVDFRRGQASIQGYDNRPHAGTGIVEFEVAVAIEHEHRDTIATLDAQLRQSTCQTIRAVGKLIPGILGLTTTDSSAVSGNLYGMSQSLCNVHLCLLSERNLLL